MNIPIPTAGTIVSILRWFLIPLHSGTNKSDFPLQSIRLKA